jgi:hypothetical protein
MISTDPVPVEVFHEVAQKLVQPPGVFLENLSVAEIHGGQKIAEVVDYIVIHQLFFVSRPSGFQVPGRA